MGERTEGRPHFQSQHGGTARPQLQHRIPHCARSGYQIVSMMDRRSFLMLPALAPLAKFANNPESGQQHFHYDFILGTSMDLVVWTGKTRDSQIIAQRIAAGVLGEIERLTSILSTRQPMSEIRRHERSRSEVPSADLSTVLDLY